MNITAADPKYATLRKHIAAKGYRVVPVPFTWNHRTVPQYVDLFVKFYEKNKGEYNLLVGNSYGAMVSFLAAPKIKPDHILLCSLSPFFAEDKDKTAVTYRIKRFGKRREQAMKQLSATKTATAVNRTGTRVTLLYGEKEKEMYPELVERVKSTARALNDNILIEVADAPHSFRDPCYIRGIELALTK